jgi:hypothetical protein
MKGECVVVERWGSRKDAKTQRKEGGVVETQGSITPALQHSSTPQTGPAKDRQKPLRIWQRNGGKGMGTVGIIAPRDDRATSVHLTARKPPQRAPSLLRAFVPSCEPKTRPFSPSEDWSLGEMACWIPNPPLLGTRLRGQWIANRVFSLVVQPPLKHAVLGGQKTLPSLTHINQRSPPTALKPTQSVPSAHWQGA